MSTLSIRKLPKELEREIRREVKSGGKTKTQIVVEALQEKFHLAKQPGKKEKIRNFFGKMSRDDYRAFQEVTRDFSNIEKDLWS